jgi:hypothetical protein
MYKERVARYINVVSQQYWTDYFPGVNRNYSASPVINGSECGDFRGLALPKTRPRRKAAISASPVTRGFRLMPL